MRYSIDWQDLDKFFSVYVSKSKKAVIGLKFLNEMIK